MVCRDSGKCQYQGSLPSVRTSARQLTRKASFRGIVHTPSALVNLLIIKVRDFDAPKDYLYLQKKYQLFFNN